MNKERRAESILSDCWTHLSIAELSTMSGVGNLTLSSIESQYLLHLCRVAIPGILLSTGPGGR